MAWRVYEIAEELNCFEQDMISFLNINGFFCNSRNDLISDKGYEFALRNFKPNPPKKPKPTPPPKTPSKPKPLTIDYREILAKYDAAAIANSPIQYFSAVRRVADESLNILQRF